MLDKIKPLASIFAEFDVNFGLCTIFRQPMKQVCVAEMFVLVNKIGRHE